MVKIMPRLKGWEKGLKAVIEKHMALPSQYGISDCYLIPDDTVEAITGERMYPDVSYSNEIGAAKALKARGFDNVEQAFVAKFEECPPSLAHRGDIGVVYNEGQICGGVFTALGFMTRTQSDVVFLDVSSVTKAFKVGR